MWAIWVYVNRCVKGKEKEGYGRGARDEMDWQNVSMDMANGF